MVFFTERAVDDFVWIFKKLGFRRAHVFGLTNIDQSPNNAFYAFLYNMLLHIFKSYHFQSYFFTIKFLDFMAIWTIVHLT